MCFINTDSVDSAEEEQKKPREKKEDQSILSCLGKTFYPSSQRLSKHCLRSFHSCLDACYDFFFSPRTDGRVEP